ncbi:hypothetical protein GCM10008967_29910 [Bacillus carboniphilus]|uniref:Uncharacterized protein n=1 Tax=Bacillus carboniphilus TaxID=86663 RepID=A0ABN0WH85_9BACI
MENPEQKQELPFRKTGYIWKTKNKSRIRVSLEIRDKKIKLLQSFYFKKVLVNLYGAIWNDSGGKKHEGIFRIRMVF